MRAGVVEHPAQWEVSGYHEIQRPRRRYCIVDQQALADALGVELPVLAQTHREWIEAALRGGEQQRQGLWTESVAVGSREFVVEVRRKLVS